MSEDNSEFVLIGGPPTTELRWFRGKLQQKFVAEKVSNLTGRRFGIVEEWKDVPEVNE